MRYRGFELDPFQETAIGHLDAGRSVLVAAPTGTGKTIIADWAVEQAMQRGQRVIYTAPIKALSNQKFRDYCRLHGEERVGLVTGDLVIRRHAPCLVMTTEILRNMLLGGDDVSDLYAVVVDEAHFLDDKDRGTVWEEVLIYLPKEVLVVALSATFPNLDAFAEWLRDVRDRQVEVVTETERAVPLELYYGQQGKGLSTPKAYDAYAKRRAKSDKGKGGGRGRGRGRGRDRRRGGRGRNRRGRRGPRTRPIHIFHMLNERGWLPFLYFVFSRSNAEKYARILTERYQLELNDRDQMLAVRAKLDAVQDEIGPSLSPSLREMYERGIAFHHAGLHVSLKALVEELYEDRLVQALFCTSTFALGINMPARTVVFDSLLQFDGEAMRPLTTRDFMQKAGRAGRRGLDDVGRVVIRLDHEEYEEYSPHLKRYRRQDYEPVRSSFNLSWNSMVRLLDQHDLDHIRTIVEKSFLNWHLTRVSENQLAEADAIEAQGDDLSKAQHKRARRLRRRAARADGRCWNEFIRKRDFLRKIAYLDDDDGFQAGARVLMHLQISEIFMTELVLEGVLEPLDGPTLFGLLCAVTSSLPRSVDRRYGFSRKERELFKRVEAVRYSRAVRQADGIAGQETPWTPELVPLGRKWAEGATLDQILSMIDSRTDYSGSLVGAFRRAKDLASQLVDVYTEDPHRVGFLQELIRTVTRDEVEVLD